MPVVQSGYDSLYKDIAHKIVLPDSPYCKQSFKVMIAFIVDEYGYVKGERVIRDIECMEISHQIFEIIRKSKWSAGTCNGQPVSVMMVLVNTVKVG